MARLTSGFLAKPSSEIPHYVWESPAGGTQPLAIRSSRDRYQIIQNLFQSRPASELKREVREKASFVFEETITNAIYHGFRRADGTHRYNRKDTVDLADNETVSVTLQVAGFGAFIEVVDNAGNLSFDAITASFRRCYQKSGPGIESKERGAGLGLYMIFEAVSHLKIVSSRGERTRFSCWIGESRHEDPDVFSFNYFERG